MAQNKLVEQYGGKLCLTCKYCNVYTGQCKITGRYNHISDNFCSKWRTAPDLVIHRKKKEKKYQQLKLL